MPIRINLLAEQQALEEMRRKDPVKRCVWVAGIIVAIMLVWSLLLQMKIWSTRDSLSRVQDGLSRLESSSFQVLTNKAKTEEIDRKLEALYRMSTNRFLCATVLNAIQMAVPDNMHLIRIRTKQDFEESPMIPMKKDGDRIIQPFKPATTTEKTRLFLDGAIDGPNPDASLDLLKSGLRSDKFLKAPFASESSLKLSNRAQIPDINDATKTIMSFTLEGIFPEITR